MWLHGDERQKKEFSKDFGAALEEIGFAVLTNHGVNPHLYRKAEEKIIAFFQNVSAGAHARYLAKRQGSVNQGYFPIRETTIIHPDLVEGWVFCRRAFDLGENPDYVERNFWPEAGFEPFFRTIVKAHEGLILPVMQAILTYLGCDPHCYDEKLTKTNFGFRLNYYPGVSENETPPSGGRMLGHEDVDLFTLLPASSQEGLQVLNRRNMKWINLNPPFGSIIINTGDYMQRITNDRLPSTTHRVAQPRNKTNLAKPRVSLPMAVYVWEDEILEVLPGLGKAKYPPVRAEDFHTRITSKYYGDDYRPEDAAQNK